MGIGLSFALNGLFYFYKMAKNKKSFILYCDIIHTVDKLPDEVAGKLFKTILNYVNDKNPEPEELILQIAFEPIKHQLKRDLKDWEVKRKKRSDAGYRVVDAIRTNISFLKEEMKNIKTQ
jgi:hypothetical protein